MVKHGIGTVRENSTICGLVAVGLFAGLLPARAQELTVPSPGQAAPATTETTPTQVPSGAVSKAAGDYIVMAEDLLDVYIMDVPEVSRGYRVGSDGFLTLPLLPEPIAAAGQTLDHLSGLIAAKFHDAGMLNNAHVSVSLVETRLHTVLLSGKVKNPQSFAIFGPTRLLDVIVKAGGLADDAGNDANITRGEVGLRADLQESTRTGAPNPSAQGASFTVDIRNLMLTGADKGNVLVYPGDHVVIQRAAMVYILGAVAHPGGYVLSQTNEEVTVMKALAMAGDVTNFAKKDRITILRRNPAGPEEKRDEIPVNYKGMVKGEISDLRLKSDDILFIPESARLKAWHTSVNSAVQVVTYGGGALMIYR